MRHVSIRPSDPTTAPAVTGIAAVLPIMGRCQPLPLDTEQLGLSLNAAGEALMRLAVRGTRPAGYRQYWPEIVQEVMDAYGYTPEDLPVSPPSSRQISAMDEALGWVDFIPLDPPRRSEAELYSRHGGAVTRRLVLMRCLISPRTGRPIYSLRRLAKVLHCSPEAARLWHARALDLILRGIRRAYR